MAGDQADDLLDLALAEIGGGPDLADRRCDGFGDDEIDRPCQTDGFLEPRIGIAQRMALRLRVGVAAAHAQIRADDNHPPVVFAPADRGRSAPPSRLRGSNQVNLKLERPRHLRTTGSERPA